MTRPRVSKTDGLPLESAIQAQIVQALRFKGWAVWEMFKGSARGGIIWTTPGIPDLYVFREGGRAVWLEVKRPGTGRLSVAQIGRHHELTLCGLPVCVVTSVEEALKVVEDVP